MSDAMEKEFHDRLTESVKGTADPERAKRSILRFIESNPDLSRLFPYLMISAKLFAASQFLANYCITNPDELFGALKERKKEITRKFIEDRAGKELAFREDADAAHVMRALRNFKKRYLLRITLRDITGETDIQTSMEELTALAERIISTALQWCMYFNGKRYGVPAGSAISLIALGKLGGEELNYSSDVDLMAVYDNYDGQTSGVPNPSGIIYNRISNHEFYCKVIELFRKILSSQTEDGIAYRVDLRLRPQGQKGDIALPLKAYQAYYESWGRTWERMMLIRARPVAGDMKLGQEFIETVRPFVWKALMGYSDIEEISGMKKKIDSAFSRDDIKRGYGGIREAEFFIHTFQLLFGGEHLSLRSYRILNSIQALKWLKKVPEKDLMLLWDNYLCLRQIEHYLQMKEDLQTHSLPSSDKELASLARQMGFSEKEEFLANLRVRRMQIKSMYNSLLGTSEDACNEALNLLEGGLRNNEIEAYLAFRNVKDPERGAASLNKIKEHLRVFLTTHERSVSRKVISQLLERAFMAESPDRAITGIETLITSYGMKGAHLTAILGQKELMQGIVKIFSLSPYLTRTFLSSHYYLDILIEEWSISKTLRAMEEKIKRLVESEGDISSSLARYKRLEEVRLGTLFLSEIMQIDHMCKGLSQLAEAIINCTVDRFEKRNLSVIGLGKLGGREMTFGSDLDIIFVSETPEAMTAAEKILKTLTAYTDTGLLYDADTRLRPDGSRGILVNTIEGYRNYYLNKARKWEIQALLKARPVGGDPKAARSFIHMVRDVILQRGGDIEFSDIRAMRQRIIRELSQESEGIDVKLGPGGIKEIEFYVQFLQLHSSKEFPEMLVQNTLTALDRLFKKKLIPPKVRDTLYSTYQYSRKLETFMRLNEVNVLGETSDIADLAARFMGHAGEEDFFAHVNKLRHNVLDIINRSRKR